MFLALIAALTVGAPSCASGTIRVDWVRADRAEECPDGQRVANDVTERLGCNAFGDSPEVRFEVLVRTSSIAGWSAEVATRSDDGVPLGHHVLRAESCPPLADAVALTVALMADSLVVDTATAAAPPASAPPTLSREPIRVVTTTVTIRQPRPYGQIVTTAGVAFNAGTLPTARWGASLVSTWRPIPAIGVGLGAVVLPIRREDETGLGLAAGWLEGCWAAARGVGALDLCARAYLGAFFSVVYAHEEVVPRSPGSHGWAAAGGLGRVTVVLMDPLVAQFELGAVVPVLRRRFDITNDDTPIHLESPVALSSVLGVGIRLE